MLHRTVGFAPHEAVAPRENYQSGVVTSSDVFKVFFKCQRLVEGYAQVLCVLFMLHCGSITGYFH